jgi:hypothetical protein
MSALKERILKEFWDYVLKHDSAVVLWDDWEDVTIYIKPDELVDFAKTYIIDFESRVRGEIDEDGDVTVEVIGSLLNGYGITLEELVNTKPENVEWS